MQGNTEDIDIGGAMIFSFLLILLGIGALIGQITHPPFEWYGWVIAGGFIAFGIIVVPLNILTPPPQNQTVRTNTR